MPPLRPSLPPLLPRLVLFSGLGVDEGLFAAQRSLPARVEVVPWVRPMVSETLPAYARRIAATIAPPDPADADRPLFLGVVSFGSMIALEAAAILKPRGVFVIAGCRSGMELPLAARLGCHLGARLSDAAIAAALLGSPLLLRMMGRPDRKDRGLLLGLVGRSIPWLTGWGCRAMLEWTGPPCPAGSLPCPVHQIHGSEDRVIPLQRLSHRPDVVIPGGGHIINVTHSDIVNAFIAERLGTE
jgi:pimeloyl-ACP methyl ester carboxylesterase